MQSLYHLLPLREMISPCHQVFDVGENIRAAALLFTSASAMVSLLSTLRSTRNRDLPKKCLQSLVLMVGTSSNRCSRRMLIAVEGSNDENSLSMKLHLLHKLEQYVLLAVLGLCSAGNSVEMSSLAGKRNNSRMAIGRRTSFGPASQAHPDPTALPNESKGNMKYI